MAPKAFLFRQGADELLALLTQMLATEHKGRRHGVSAIVLANKLHVAERMLRYLISRAREEGVAVVGTPETGYYLANNAQELEECCQFLRSRAMHSLRIEARLRNMALPELLGQLRIGT